MKQKSFEHLLANVKEEPPVEFVLILPTPTHDWPARKLQEDVKPKLVPTVKLTKFDTKWPRDSKLFQTFFTCPHCQLVVKRQGHLTRHLKTCSKINERRFVCDICGKRFQKKSSVRQHMLKHSKERKFCCTKCGFGFKTKGDLQRHSRSKKINRCAVCEVEFSCQLLLDRHQKEFHGNVFKCDKCWYQTKIERYMMSHKRIHNKPFVCEICQQKFALMYHQMQHRHGFYATAPEQTFDCDKCDKSFSTPSHLRNHQNSVRDDKEVKCKVCGKIFRNRVLLRNHGKIHNKVECSICHKRISKYSMPAHLRSHSAENPFNCDLCNFSTKTRKCVKVHIERMHLRRKLVNDFKSRADFRDFKLIEKLQLTLGSSATTDEKKFKCDKCEKSFVAPHNLRQHKRGVHSEELFECQSCKKTYKTKAHLNRHKSRGH